MSILRLPAVAAFLAVAIAPMATDAQTTPCVGCYINASESAAQVQAHQILVQSSVQRALNDRLNAQSTNQTLQAMQMRNQLLNDINANSSSLQTILLEQQLLLLRTTARQSHHAAAPGKKTTAKPRVRK